jgi:hypothetical protein
VTNQLPSSRRRRRHAGITIGLVAALVAIETGGLAAQQANRDTGQLGAYPSHSAPSAPIAAIPDRPERRGQASALAHGTPELHRATLPVPRIAGGGVRESPAAGSRPTRRPFAVDLFDRGDFVAQARSDWCVPASILSMINMIGSAGVRKPPSQRVLDRMARRFSSPRLRGAGSEPEGWARTLNRLGYGPYVVHAEPTRAAAISAAARAIRLTGRPVGLLVWRGAHAWVVSGFRATADPAASDDFTVTHLMVLDPWYPRRSSVWGPSLRPDAVVRVQAMAADYLAWHRPTVRYREKDGRFILVVPVGDASVFQDRPREPDDRAGR